MSPQSSSFRCPRCASPLPSDAPDGLCPKCLMALNLGSETVFPGALTADADPARAALPIEALAPLFPGFELLECLGRGGMGVVYKARQKSLDRLVALKLVAPERAADPRFAARFEKEARALAALNHPNIVTVHDHGRAADHCFLVMEYVDGVTLRGLLEGGRISAREALAIVPQICDALQYAHDAGIVHRDIKPENILLDRRGRVKVADFGLAKLVAGPGDAPASAPGVTGGGATEVGAATLANELTDAGKVMGTPHYMSPEQIQAPGEVDHRADIYALGVVFYQMLTGELPGKQLEPPSRKVRLDVRLDEVVLRALEENPGRRYANATEFKTSVETISSASGVSEAPRSPAPVVLRWRDRWLWDTQNVTLMIFAPVMVSVLLAVLPLPAFGAKPLLGVICVGSGALFAAMYKLVGIRVRALKVGLPAMGCKVEVAEALIFERPRQTPGIAVLHDDRLELFGIAVIEKLVVPLGEIASVSEVRVFNGKVLWWKRGFVLDLKNGRRIGVAVPEPFGRKWRARLSGGTLPELGAIEPAPGVGANEVSAGIAGARFSRTATLGVGFAFASLAVGAFGPILTSWLIQTGRADTWIIHIGKLLLFALAAASSVLGWVAVSRIRRSAGKLSGLWLAVFDGVFGPLLLVDFFLTFFFHKFGILCGWWTQYYDDRSNAALIVWSCVTWPLVDFLIVRRVWRAVNQSLMGQPAPVTARHSSNRTYLAVAFGVMLLGIFGAQLLLNRHQAGPRAVVGGDGYNGIPQESARQAITPHLEAAGLRWQGMGFGPVNESVLDWEVYLVRLEERRGVNGQNVWQHVNGFLRLHSPDGSRWEAVGERELGHIRFSFTTVPAKPITPNSPVETAQKLSFGSVMERVLPLDPNGSAYIDFQTGNILNKNWKLEEAIQDEKVAAWMKSTGADANAYLLTEADAPVVEPRDLNDLWPRLIGTHGGCAFVLARNETFESARAEDADSRLKEIPGRNLVQEYAIGSQPYWFKTGDGAKGIVQIHSLTSNPRAAQIRYKLVRRAEPKLAEAPDAKLIAHYRDHRDGESLYALLYRYVSAGDTRARIEKFLGLPNTPLDQGRTVQVCRQLAAKRPQGWPDGVQDADTFLGYQIERGGELTLQFRDGRLVNFIRDDFAKYEPLMATAPAVVNVRNDGNAALPADTTASFGRQSERALAADRANRDGVIGYRFSDNDAVDVPESVTAHFRDLNKRGFTPELTQWMRDNRVDTVFHFAEKFYDVLWLDMRNDFIAQPKEWDTVSPDKAAPALKRAEELNTQQTGPGISGGSGYTDGPTSVNVFRTREGFTGYYQIRAFADMDGHGVMIRTKEILTQKPNGVVASPKLSFGPVTERVIEPANPDRRALNLAFGNFISSGLGRKLDFSEAGMDTLRAAGVDLFSPEVSSGGFVGVLTALDMRLCFSCNPTGPEDFDQLTAAQLEQLVAHMEHWRENMESVAIPGTEMMFRNATSAITKNTLYVFVTRNDVKGALQIQDDPRGVRVRYKVVSPAAGAAESVPSGAKRQKFAPQTGIANQTTWTVLDKPSDMNPDGWALVARMTLGGSVPVRLPGSAEDICRVTLVDGDDERVTLKIDDLKRGGSMRITLRRDQDAELLADGKGYRVAHPSRYVAAGEPDAVPCALVVVTEAKDAAEPLPASSDSQATFGESAEVALMMRAENRDQLVGYRFKENDEIAVPKELGRFTTSADWGYSPELKAWARSNHVDMLFHFGKRTIEIIQLDLYDGFVGKAWEWDSVSPAQAWMVLKEMEAKEATPPSATLGGWGYRDDRRPVCVYRTRDDDTGIYQLRALDTDRGRGVEIRRKQVLPPKNAAAVL